MNNGNLSMVVFFNSFQLVSVNSKTIMIMANKVREIL